jgi:hypothetical protein
VRAIETHGRVARVDLDTRAGNVAAILAKETLRDLALSAGCDVTLVVPPGAFILERSTKTTSKERR